MTEYLVGDGGLFQAALLAVIISGIPLIAGMIVGLVVSILQAATQVQEQTLSFVPKIATIALVLFVCGRWMASELVNYFTSVLNAVAEIGLG